MVRGGHLIKTARKARGMSQEYIAEAFGLDRVTGKEMMSAKSISRYETFVSEPKYKDVIKIIVDICKLSLSEVEELTYENN